MKRCSPDRWRATSSGDRASPTKFTDRGAGRSRKSVVSRRSNRGGRRPRDGGTRRRRRRETQHRNRSVGLQRLPSIGRCHSSRTGWRRDGRRRPVGKRPGPHRPSRHGLREVAYRRTHHLRRRHREGMYLARPDTRPRRYGTRRGRRRPSTPGLREERAHPIPRHNRVNQARRSRDGGTCRRRRICRG